MVYCFTCERSFETVEKEPTCSCGDKPLQVVEMTTKCGSCMEILHTGVTIHEHTCGIKSDLVMESYNKEGKLVKRNGRKV